MGVGSEIGQICGVFSSKDSKNAHFFDLFLNGYIHPNNFKKQKQALGLCPKPHSLGEAAGAGGKPYPPTPTVSVVDSKASRVKCTTSSLLTPLHLRGVAKLTEADGAGNLSRLAKQPRSGLAFYRLEATQRSAVRVQEVFPCTPCHVANAGVGSAHGVGKTLGGRAVGGKMCRRHSF